MNDFARVESRPKRKALAVWFITYLRERSRKRLINKLQTQTKCRTRWAPRDVRRCAEACHVPERCVVPLFTSWHRLNTSRRGKLQEKFKHELAGLKRMLRLRVKRASQRQSTARTACRYCTWRTHQYSDAEYLAHLSGCAGANGRLRAIELRPAKVVCLRPRCSFTGTASELQAHTKKKHTKRKRTKKDEQCLTCKRFFTSRGLPQHSCNVTKYCCGKCLAAKTSSTPHFDSAKGLALHASKSHKASSRRRPAASEGPAV